MSLTLEEQKELLHKNLRVVPVDASLADMDRFHRFRSWVETFDSEKSEILSAYIYDCGWHDDAIGNTKLYLVIDTSLIKDGRPISEDVDPVAFYFGLKCGQLYLPDHIELTDYEDTFVEYYKSSLIQDDKHYQKQLQNLAGNFMKEDRMKELIAVAKKRYRAMIDRKLMGERERTILVDECFPAVELTHFVKNDRYKLPEGVEISLGEYVFWEFVADKILKLSKDIAIQYIYLFAADDTAQAPRYVDMVKAHDERMAELFKKLNIAKVPKPQAPEMNKLIGYYEKRLNFQLIDDMNLLKPSYDYICFSMKQSIKELQFKKQAFWMKYMDC